MHSDAIWSDVLEVGTAEKLLKLKTLIARCILTVFETIFWEVELLRKFWNQGRWMLLSYAIDSMFSEVGTAEKRFKTKSLNGAFCRNLKQCFGRLNCWENFENEVAYWCILSQYEMMFEIGTAKKILKTRLLNCSFFRILKRCFGSLNCW